MKKLSLSLDDILIDPDQEVDLEELSVEEAQDVITRCYSFLPPPVEVAISEGVATLSWAGKPPRNPQETEELFQRGVRLGERGNYVRAVDNFKRVLERSPDHVEARRNLGMAYLEMGVVEKGKESLAQAARLAPDDPWTFLLLANVFSKYEGDHEKAARFYRKALALNPNDPFILTSFGGSLISTGRAARGRELLERAREADSGYPNAIYGLALLDAREDKYQEALGTLDDLFGRPKSADPRTEPVYQAARELYVTASTKLAQASYDESLKVIEARKEELERLGGHPITIREDNSIKTDAVSQMAWNHNSDTHRIKYRSRVPAITPHHLAHELEHILLEQEARSAGRNRAFATTAATREKALKSISQDITRLQRQGYPESQILEIVLQLVGGLCGQLFNIPLDMVIESRVFEHYPQLRASQFVSLHAAQTENAQILTNPDIQKVTPTLIFRASTALNCAYALFTDHLYDGKTQYAQAYKDTPVWKTGQELFALWQRMRPDYQHGDEYRLVDESARILGLAEWFEWQEGAAPPRPSVGLEAPEERPEGTTNPELLKRKEPATVMYLLGALQRFETMSHSEIQGIAFEIGMVGQSGIDYADPDRRYHLRSLPDEEFTGLQLLATMFVGFKKIAPEMDTGLDFEDAYQTALQLHEGDAS